MVGRAANPWDVNTYYKAVALLLDDVDDVRQVYGRFSFSSSGKDMFVARRVFKKHRWNRICSAGSETYTKNC